MHTEGEAVLLRIFIGESDKHGHLALYEALVRAARSQGIAGATVLRGICGYGSTAEMRQAKVLDLSSDLPVVVEIIEKESRIEDFMVTVDRLMEESNSGGFVTMEKAHVLRYFQQSGDGD